MGNRRQCHVGVWDATRVTVRPAPDDDGSCSSHWDSSVRNGHEHSKNLHQFNRNPRFKPGGSPVRAIEVGMENNGARDARVTWTSLPGPAVCRFSNPKRERGEKRLPRLRVGLRCTPLFVEFRLNRQTAWFVGDVFSEDRTARRGIRPPEE